MYLAIEITSMLAIGTEMELKYIIFRNVFLTTMDDKTDCHDITDILLKVALNTITVIIYFQLSFKVIQ
jgi:hypothetical protein